MLAGYSCFQQDNAPFPCSNYVFILIKRNQALKIQNPTDEIQTRDPLVIHHYSVCHHHHG